MRLTVRADGFEGWARRGRERAEKLARGEKIAAEKTINFGSALESVDGGTDAVAGGDSEAGLLGYRAGSGAEARPEVSAARCAEAGAGGGTEDTGGDQSGTWPGQDCGARGKEGRDAG